MHESLTVLYVEDDAAVRRGSKQALELAGLAVEAFESAEQVLKHIELGAPVVLVTDVRLPHMDGIELLRHVRGHEKHSALPFVLVTAMSEKEYIAKAKELKVNGYILKPVTFQRVTEKMQELFPSRVLPKLVG